MSAEHLRQMDDAAAALAGAYQRMGIKCLVVRRQADGMTRVIGPANGAVEAAQFLNQCADAIFDGPVSIVEKG